VVSPAGVFAGGGSLKRLPPSVAATGERFMLFLLCFVLGLIFGSGIWSCRARGETLLRHPPGAHQR